MAEIYDCYHCWEICYLWMFGLGLSVGVLISLLYWIVKNRKIGDRRIDRQN